ncbi:MAG: DUF1080 domain-containing protein [Sedimentisphaerales bacterium]|nr:DUF1080 domain-containing protein [Sedimentisphaerales bacterium]
MRLINQIVLLTGICFCVAGCAIREANKNGSQNLSNSLEAWNCFLADAEADMQDVWSIDNGILICKGKPLGYIYTRKDYDDFVLTLEWRWPPGKKAGKGGVLIRTTGGHKIWPRSLEAQLNADNAGDFWGLDGYSLSGPAERMQTLDHEKFGQLTNLKKTIALEKAPGEWNTYQIIAKGSTVTLIINGEEVNQATGCDLTPGKICLTSEGDEIHFRNVVLTSTN